MLILKLIQKAIENKNILQFDYDGHHRQVEPHHFGILKGKNQLQAYQIAGTSQHGHPRGWKNFEISKIKNLTIDNKSFQPRKDHRPLNANYSMIKKSVT